MLRHGTRTKSGCRKTRLEWKLADECYVMTLESKVVVKMCAFVVMLIARSRLKMDSSFTKRDEYYSIILSKTE
jgi:hypothetical protein